MGVIKRAQNQNLNNLSPDLLSGGLFLGRSLFRERCVYSGTRQTQQVVRARGPGPGPEPRAPGPGPAPEPWGAQKNFEVYARFAHEAMRVPRPAGSTFKERCVLHLIQ